MWKAVTFERRPSQSSDKKIQFSLGSSKSKSVFFSAVRAMTSSQCWEMSEDGIAKLGKHAEWRTGW